MLNSSKTVKIIKERSVLATQNFAHRTLIFFACDYDYTRGSLTQTSSYHLNHFLKKRKFSFPSCRIFFQPCPEKDRFNINPTSYNSIHPTTRGEAVIITMMCMALHECTISSSLLTGVSIKTLPEAQRTHALTRWRH